MDYLRSIFAFLIFVVCLAGSDAMAQGFNGGPFQNGVPSAPSIVGTASSNDGIYFGSNRVGISGHFESGARVQMVPALSGCGTTPSLAAGSTDTAGTVTMGTTATGCVITFGVAYTASPTCVVSWRATPLASQSYTVSTTAITTTQTSTSNNVLDYWCPAKSGG